MQHIENRDNTITRDTELDIFRGFVMMYIVGFIHVAQHTLLNWYYNTPTTFLLIEMPIIFYISGAAYSLSRKKPYVKYAIGRFKRIFIPLFVFLCVYALVSWSAKNFITKEIEMSFSTYFLNTLDGQYDTSHLWFIRPYLVLALLSPLLYRFSKHLNRYTIYIPLVIAMAILYFYPNYAICYAIPLFAGFFYHQAKPYNIYAVLLIMLCGVLFCHLQGYSWNMQINKFPSNLMFLSYTSAVLIILHKPLKWCCIRLAQISLINYIVKQYARYDFTIYLYHLLIISIIRHIYSILGMHIPIMLHPAVSYSLIAIATILCMIPTARCMEYVNTQTTRLLSYLYHKLVAAIKCH